MKKSFTRAVATTLAALAVVPALAAGNVAGSAVSSGSSEGTTIPEGTTLRVQDTAAQTLKRVMEASGVLEDAPYTVEFSIGASAAAMIQALQADAVDLEIQGEGPTIQAAAAGTAGEDLKIVGVGTQEGYPLWIVAQPGSGIKKVADLKGKSVATSNGTVLEAFLAEALADADLALSDIEVVNVLPPQILAAMASGDVDAAVIPGQLFTAYRADNPDAIVVRDGADSLTGQNYLVTSKTALSDKVKEAAIGDFVQRYATALQWTQDNTDEYIQKLYVEIQKTTLEDGEFLNDITGVQAALPITAAVIKKQQDYADFLHEIGGIETKVKVKPMFDKRYNALVKAALAKNKE